MRVRPFLAAAALACTGCAAARIPSTPATSTTLRDAANSESRLFVANASTVTVYRDGASPSATIRKVIPLRLAVDANGDVAVSDALADNARDAVLIYSPHGVLLHRIPTRGYVPKALLFDPSGTLFVTLVHGVHGSVAVYPPGATTAARTITEGIGNPGSLAMDGIGNLYVGNVGRDVTVYAPGSDSVLRTISQDIRGPLAIAIDKKNRLWAVNNQSITEYRAFSTRELKMITAGIVFPSGLAFDPAGNLFVANWGADPALSRITIYGPGDTRPSRTIGNGISDPLSPVFDASGNLYVANDGNDAITVYPPGAASPSATITIGVERPRWLAIGP